MARGDAGVIVAEYQFGNTIVRINDAYIVQTEEERELIETQIATAAYECLVDEDSQ
jgi:hypothetical protein